MGLGPAEVTITARTEDGGFEDACVYTLGQAVTEIRPIPELSEEKPYLYNGTMVTITVSPENAAIRTGIQATFTSEPANVIDYIEKKSETKFMVYFTKLGGRATVTFTAGDGSGTTGSCEFYVAGYVDMGLSKKWMNCDVNTTRPWTLTGERVAWGEVYSEEQYELGNYKWYDSANGKYTKYATWAASLDAPLIALESGDDVAKSAGSQLRTPTKAEWEELLNGCTWQKTTLNGTAGYLATSKANGNTLFFPHNVYWTSERANFINVTQLVIDRAYRVDLDNVESGVGYCYRWEGHYVRPVVD